jgi:hypothetical protein
MQTLITLLSIAALAVVVVQDFRQRMISWYLVPILFMLFAANALLAISIIEAAYTFTVNLAFIILQLLMLTIYFSLRKRRLINIIDTWLGLGDVLLFIVLCTAFSPVNYFIFYLSSLLLAIIGFGIYKAFKGASNTIPLAGTMSIAMIILLSLQVFIDPSRFYSDMHVLNFLRSF